MAQGDELIDSTAETNDRHERTNTMASENVFKGLSSVL